MRVVERQTRVDAPIEAVWARVVTPEGINDELRPVMTMGMPRGSEGVNIDTVVVGRPLGRAWLRLFGLIPFDYDDLTIVAIEPGRSFHERSTMLSMRHWEHERSLAPEGPVTLVSDRLTFAPRIPGTGALMARVISALFGHRHRRLRRFFS
ncbi:hypothetical protein [Nocardioides limicola]|uniref:hypothetical protein n=1 Tax=Nocardioides limicola TaxID=2803368 RepID=UPI00193B2AE8|nr:hypothetical protein [Nocardioides sp. DJM-14]